MPKSRLDKEISNGKKKEPSDCWNENEKFQENHKVDDSGEKTISSSLKN